MFKAPEYDNKDLFEINNLDLEKYPNNSHFLNFKGLIYFNEGNLAKAIMYVNKAINLEKDNVDFLRNKALILIEMGYYAEAYDTIEYSLGLEPDYPKLKEIQEDIDKKIDQDDLEDRFNKIKQGLKKHSKSLQNIKFEFIEISALFVAILTLVVRIITFDYKNFENVSFSKILLYQFAINLPWIFSLLIILIVIIIIHIRKN